MKIGITPLKRILAILLILATICSVLASCATDGESESDSGTNDSYAENGENNGDVESEDGIIPIFANGAYTAKLIRGDMASAFEKEIYNQIRELLKKHTGVNPEFCTDFVISGEEKYDGPAILIGETNYTESKTANNKLGASQATGTILGNKYVIAVSSSDAFDKFLTKFKSYLKKCPADEVTINSSWKISEKIDFVSSGNETFDETGLIKNATLPNLGTGYDAGQGSKTYVKTGANKSTFESLCTEIESKGLKKYTSNVIGNNYFVTYVTQTQIVHTMFFANRSEIRTAVDQRGLGTDGKFSLPGLSGDNKYQKTTDSEMIVCDISNADWPGGMCIIFKLSDGRFFIIDAGMGGKLSDNRQWIGSSSGWIYQTLARHAKDPKNIVVAGWLITHVHSDHAGGLYDMALGYYGATNADGGKKHTVMPKEMTKYIKIEQLIYNKPATTKFGRNGWMDTIIKAFDVKNVVKAHPGQVFYAADFKLTIYGSQDIMLEKSGDSGDLNDFSLVARTEFNGKSALFLGDSDTIPNPRLAQVYKETLKSDLLQLAHHGYGDTGDADVNSYCNPSMVLWVVSNRDLRSGQKINVNSSIANLSGAKNYKPGTGNLIFKSDWSTYTESASTIINAIPKCDGTHCGNSNCNRKTSTWNSYNNS